MNKVLTNETATKCTDEPARPKCDASWKCFGGIAAPEGQKEANERRHMKMQVFVNRFYPEEFRRKSDAEKYHSKGTWGMCIICVKSSHFKFLKRLNDFYRINKTL